MINDLLFTDQIVRWPRQHWASEENAWKEETSGGGHTEANKLSMIVSDQSRSYNDRPS